jgi:hypothetical protein
MLRWSREGEDFVLEYSLSIPLLGKLGPRIGPAGVVGGGLRRKRWRWPDIAVVTWDLGAGGQATLAVCLYGDPYVKALDPIGPWRWSWTEPWEEVRALLEPIRPLVEAHGARVENRDEPATHWWYLDPKARRG